MSDYQPEHRAGDPPNEEPVVGDPPPNADTLLSNSVYDKLKQVAAVWLPALAVFYITVAPFWGFPKQEEVAGTIMALDLLLGAGLSVLSKGYRNSEARFDGSIDVVEDMEKEQTQMNFRLDPQAVAGKDEIVLQITRQN